MNYNDVEIYITWRCLVKEHQYFPILITCDVNFKNIMKLYRQSGMNMMELDVSSQPKLSILYNMEHEDSNVYIPIFVHPFKQLSHSTGVNTSRTLEDN
jgi:hypothetical protein